MLSAPSQVREKILLFGSGGVGKTTAWLSIALAAQQSGSEAKFYVLDTDDAVPAMLLGEQNATLQNIEVYPAYDWVEYQGARDKILGLANEGDWIVIDFMDKAWKAVQEWFVREIHGMGLAEFFMQERQAGKTGWDLYRGVDWGVVNPEYDSFAKPFLLKSRAHLVVVCEESQIGDADDQEKKRMFSLVKPTGQKSLPYQVRTIMHLERSMLGRTLTTIKDRERPELKREVYSNFCLNYLCQVAGWKL